jgi:cellulose biosynthesis protein BcsQ
MSIKPIKKKKKSTTVTMIPLPVLPNPVYWAIATVKGGAGKTTLAVHHAEFLNTLAPGKVLVVNFDAQDNVQLSLTLLDGEGGRIPENEFITSLDLFHCDEDAEGNLAPPNHIKEKKLYQNSRGIYLIPSKKDFIQVEKMELDALLNPIENLDYLVKKYDIEHVVIDSKPGRGVVMTAAMFVADFVIAPTVAHVYGLKGIIELCYQIQLANINRRDFGLPPAKLLGVVLNQTIKDRALAVKESKQLREYLEGAAIETEIELRNPIRDTTSLGVPVWELTVGRSIPANNEMIQSLNDLMERAGKMFADNSDPYGELVEELAEEYSEED